MSEIKVFGYIVVSILLLSAIILPLVEVFNVTRERVMLYNNIHNSFRAARDSSYTYHEMRRLNSVVFENRFKEGFADTFATSFGINCRDSSGNTLLFEGNDVYNDFIVEIEFGTPIIYDIEDYSVMTVAIEASTRYKFKIGMLVLATRADPDPFQLKCKREFTIRLIN